MRVENNNVSGQNHDPEQIDLIDLLVQLWRGKMTIIISVIVAIALAIGYLAVAKEKWTSTAIVTQPDVGQIAGYNNAINVIYGSAAPKVSEIQSMLIGRFSTTFSALAETLDNQEAPEKLAGFAEDAGSGRSRTERSAYPSDSGSVAVCESGAGDKATGSAD